MKSIKKFIFVMAALAAVFAFVACSNGSDDGGSSNNNNNSSNNNASDNSNNNGNDNNSNSNSNSNGNSGNSNTVAKPSVVVTYESVSDDKTLTFFSDGTWSVSGYNGSTKVTFSNGKYSGHPESNGPIKFTYIQGWDDKFSENTDLDPRDSVEECTVKDGVLNFDYSWDYDYIDFKRK